MKTQSFLQQILGERVESSNVHGTITIGKTEFNPPFKSINTHVVDADGQTLCKCESDKTAVGLVNLLWDLI